MSSLNTVVISGKLGRDPEIKRFDSGKVKVSLSVTVTESYKDKAQDELREFSTYVDVSLWGDKALQIADTASKGTEVVVHGKLKTESWEGKDGSGKKYKLTVAADSVKAVVATTGGERLSDGLDFSPTPAALAPPADDVPF